eukprot:jgi/Psemu1/49138/gm1.49138_g
MATVNGPITLSEPGPVFRSEASLLMYMKRKVLFRYLSSLEALAAAATALTDHYLKLSEDIDRKHAEADKIHTVREAWGPLYTKRLLLLSDKKDGIDLPPIYLTWAKKGDPHLGIQPSPVTTAVLKRFQDCNFHSTDSFYAADGKPTPYRRRQPMTISPSIGLKLPLTELGKPQRQSVSADPSPNARPLYVPRIDPSPDALPFNSSSSSSSSSAETNAPHNSVNDPDQALCITTPPAGRLHFHHPGKRQPPPEHDRVSPTSNRSNLRSISEDWNTGRHDRPPLNRVCRYDGQAAMDSTPSTSCHKKTSGLEGSIPLLDKVFRPLEVQDTSFRQEPVSLKKLKKRGSHVDHPQAHGASANLHRVLGGAQINTIVGHPRSLGLFFILQGPLGIRGQASNLVLDVFLASSMGACDVLGTGMVGIHSSFPRWVPNQLVSFDNPNGTINNSDLELAGPIAHNDKDHPQLAAVYWQRKGADMTMAPASYLLGLQSLHQRLHKYAPLRDYIHGPNAHWKQWVHFCLSISTLWPPPPICYRSNPHPPGRSVQETPYGNCPVATSLSDLAQYQTPSDQWDMRWPTWGQNLRTNSTGTSCLIKPIHIALVMHALGFSYYTSPTSTRQAIANMICIAFFFFLRPGEDTSTTTRDDQAFLFQDASFYLGSRLLHCTELLHELQAATSITLTFTTQKKGDKGESSALWQLVLLVNYINNGVLTPVWAETVTKATRIYAQTLYPTTGISLGKCDSNVIKLLAHWHSDCMMRYLHQQSLPISKNLASLMFNNGAYSFPPDKGPDQQPASTLKDVKEAVACGVLDQTNTRTVSLKEETKDPNHDGRLHWPKDDDDYDSNEEMKMEVDQDLPELDSDDPSDRRIMRVMEKAMTDPEMNSTWKRVIYQEVKKRIRAIQDAVDRGRNPDNVHSSDDSSDDNENQPDDSSRSKRYDRRSSQPRITIRGFNNGKILNPEQLAFRSSLMDFGINYESAAEIMRGGLSNICEITDLNKESIKSFMHGLKSVSPDCPNPKSIHYGNRLSSRLLTWANWACYQPLIGVKPRAIDWNANPNNLELQQFRIKMMESSVKSQEKATPPELKDLTKFTEWEEGFRQNLRYRFNSEGFPILYVIRPQEKENVDDEARSGTVGQNPTDVYPTWSDYNERCGVLLGHQYDEDNNVVCRLLCDATRKGPGWKYVAHFQNTELNSGHARNAFISLMQHTYTDTSITMVLNKTYQEMKESHYTGNAKNYDWNKHKRNWTAFHGTIMRFEKNHNERRFVWDFINSISDERLDAAKADAIDESKDYRDNFNECLILFTNRLGLKKLANGKHKRSSRSVYSVGTSSNKKQKTNGTFTGKLENKPYPTSVYKTMSKEQCQELYQTRQASKKKRALKAAETKKAKEAEKEGAGDSFGSKS